MVLDLKNLPFSIIISRNTIVPLQVISQCIDFYVGTNKGKRPTHLFMSCYMHREFLKGLSRHIPMHHDNYKPLLFMDVKICRSDSLDDEEIVISRKK